MSPRLLLPSPFFMAALSEMAARRGIRAAFTFHERKARLCLLLADLAYKGSYRATLLGMALSLMSDDREMALARYNGYLKTSHNLRKLAPLLKERCGTAIQPEVRSLARSWEAGLTPPRQVRRPYLQAHGVKTHPPFPPLGNGRQIVQLITDDHEWSITQRKSFGLPFLSLYEAEIQLIRKGRLINRIAAEAGIPWVHLIDIGSYLSIKRGAELFPGTWGRLVSDFEAFLTETVAMGHDLGVHVHTDKSHLAVKRVERERIWIDPDIRQWGRLPDVGSTEDIDSKTGLVAAGKKLIEDCGRSANGSFRAVLFRAGSYATGTNAAESRDSMEAVRRNGILFCSDALAVDGITESLGRKTGHTIYRAKFGYPWAVEEDESRPYLIQVLPLRTRDFPVYSVVAAARRYRKDRRVLERTADEAGKGNGLLISMDHDIDINSASTGQRWDSLDPEAGDWKFLRYYLKAMKESGAFRFITTQDLHKLIGAGETGTARVGS